MPVPTLPHPISVGTEEGRWATRGPSPPGADNELRELIPYRKPPGGCTPSPSTAEALPFLAAEALVGAGAVAIAQTEVWSSGTKLGHCRVTGVYFLTVEGASHQRRRFEPRLHGGSWGRHCASSCAPRLFMYTFRHGSRGAMLAALYRRESFHPLSPWGQQGQ